MITRRVLDEAGLPDARVVASGGLDEYRIEVLVRAGAPIDTYATGTRVGVSAEVPYLDSAYKLVAYDGRPVMKLSTVKVPAPGPKQVFRRSGYPDVIALEDEDVPLGAEPLLATVMSHGRRTSKPEPLAWAHARFAADLAALPHNARRTHGPIPPRVTRSDALDELTQRVRRRIEDEMLAIT